MKFYTGLYKPFLLICSLFCATTSYSMFDAGLCLAVTVGGCLSINLQKQINKIEAEVPHLRKFAQDHFRLDNSIAKDRVELCKAINMLSEGISSLDENQKKLAKASQVTSLKRVTWPIVTTKSQFSQSAKKDSPCDLSSHGSESEDNNLENAEPILEGMTGKTKNLDLTDMGGFPAKITGDECQ